MYQLSFINILLFISLVISKDALPERRPFSIQGKKIIYAVQKFFSFKKSLM